MAKETFNIDSLKGISGGRVVEALEQAIHRCGKDVVDRPGVKGARVVMLQVSVAPVAQADLHDPNSNAIASIQCTIRESVPDRKSEPFNVEVRGNGALIFNPASPNNVRQGTLDSM